MVALTEVRAVLEDAIGAMAEISAEAYCEGLAEAYLDELSAPVADRAELRRVEALAAGMRHVEWLLERWEWED